MALKSISVMVIALCFVSVWSCSNQSYVETVVKEKLPEINLDSYPEVKEFLVEEVSLCGKGVIDKTKGENTCTHNIEVTQEMVERFKTGLKHDKDNETDGKQWVMPTEEEIKALPEAWDIRDLNPAVKDVKIDRQTCGSCWANSSAKLLDLQIAVNDGKILDQSEQYLVSNCIPTGDCNGGYMTTPDQIIKNRFGGAGLPLEIDDPYRGVNTACKWSKEKMAEGWEYKLKGAPWVGSSLMYSKGKPRDYRGNTAEMLKAAAYKYKSGLLVTTNAFDVAGNGIVSSCSFGETNHMVVISGWGKENGVEYASVWNSWGKGHGLNGISRIKWECGGAGKLNRRLGEEARVYVYEPACQNQPDAHTGPSQTIIKLNPQVGVLLGKKAKPGQTCSWLPKEGLSDSESCNPFASPDVSTEYHLTAKTECGEATSMVMVNVLGPKLEKSVIIKTPFGLIKGE